MGQVNFFFFFVTPKEIFYMKEKKYMIEIWIRCFSVCCSDFPFVVLECGYKEAKEAVTIIAKQASLSSSDMDWILGKTVMQLFPGQWVLP